MAAQCSVFIATSLDGFIARKDNGLDWLKIVERADEDYGYAEFARTIDTIVMGRNTYDVVADFEPWPYAGKRMIVMTHRPLASRHGAEAFGGSPQELASTLVGRVYVDGGATIREFLAAGLITDLTLSVIPVLLGEGIPLFGGVAHDLQLEGVKHWSGGLVQLRYQTKSRR
jgi:dihydrofolate reductase